MIRLSTFVLPVREKTADQGAITHLSDVRVAVVIGTVIENLGCAPGLALVSGANRANAPAPWPVFLRKGDMGVTCVKNAEEFAVFKTTDVRKSLVRPAFFASGNNPRRRDFGPQALSSIGQKEKKKQVFHRRGFCR